MKAAVRHDDFMRERLADVEFAAGYLQAALEDGDLAVLLLALRRVAEAHGGMAKVAQTAGLSREAHCRTLSVSGNPRLSSLAAILRAAGLRLAFVPVKQQPRAPKRVPMARKRARDAVPT